MPVLSQHAFFCLFLFVVDCRGDKSLVVEEFAEEVEDGYFAEVEIRGYLLVDIGFSSQV